MCIHLSQFFDNVSRELVSCVCKVQVSPYHQISLATPCRGVRGSAWWKLHIVPVPLFRKTGTSNQITQTRISILIAMTLFTLIPLLNEILNLALRSAMPYMQTKYSYQEETSFVSNYQLLGIHLYFHLAMHASPCYISCYISRVAIYHFTEIISYS